MQPGISKRQVCRHLPQSISAVAFASYGLQNLAIPDSAEAIAVYGQSGAGRNLMVYRFGHEDNVIVLGFAIHGYEDNWFRDGGALVYTAGQLMHVTTAKK